MRGSGGCDRLKNWVAGSEEQGEAAGVRVHLYRGQLEPSASSRWWAARGPSVRREEELRPIERRDGALGASFTSARAGCSASG